MAKVTGLETGGQMSGQAAADGTDRPRWRGERFGLPESGPGSAAPLGRRAVAFFADIALAALVTSLFTMPELPGNWSLTTWLLMTIVPVSFFGVTPGMVFARIWVARLDGAAMVGPPRALLRAVLTMLLIPAAVWNLDGRAWHDRLSGTVVLSR